MDEKRLIPPDERLDEGAAANVNVADAERVASATAGLGLALVGLKRGGAPGAVMGVLGAALLHRAATGRCRLYAALGTGTASRIRSPVASVPHGQGLKLERAVTVQRPRDELYRFWRDFRNLPHFMEDLESVEETGPGRSRWVARGPAGKIVSWEAEIVNERENELIAWRSLPGADVDHAGSVQFRPAPGDRGTEVKVVAEYRPPAGAAGVAVAKLLGADPAARLREDLRRFKQIMEAGEAPTTEGQPSGRTHDTGLGGR